MLHRLRFRAYADSTGSVIKHEETSALTLFCSCGSTDQVSRSNSDSADRLHTGINSTAACLESEPQVLREVSLNRFSSILHEVVTQETLLSASRTTTSCEVRSRCSVISSSRTPSLFDAISAVAFLLHGLCLRFRTSGMFTHQFTTACENGTPTRWRFLEPCGAEQVQYTSSSTATWSRLSPFSLRASFA